MSKYKSPPDFEGKSYDAWRNEIVLWQRVTELDVSKQAVAVALSLSGHYREVAMTLSADTLNSQTGMRSLLAELDKSFKKDSIDVAYEAYRNFEHFHRVKDSSMISYVIEFERRHAKLKEHGFEIPDGIRGCKLLEQASLDSREKQMVLSSCTKLEYCQVQSALKRIFSGMADVGRDSRVEVKNEAFIAHHGRDQKRKAPEINTDKSGRKTNPKSKDGRTTRCACCGSIYHWAASCPDSDRTKAPQAKSAKSEVNSAFVEFDDIPSESTEESLITLALSTGSALLSECFGRPHDTACTSNVCGVMWIQNLLSNMPEDDLDKVKSNASGTNVMFGDMETMKSLMKITFPVNIAGISCTITTDVIEGELPLLMSKHSMKKAKCCIDMHNDTMRFMGKLISLKTSSSGHYLLPLLSSCQITAMMTIQDFNDSTKRKKCLNKLHRQFGHCSITALEGILRSAKLTVKQSELSEVVKSCQICHAISKPLRKPIVSLPMASDFNQVISMDLHQLDKCLWYLHVICLYSRYSVAISTTSKEARTIIQKLMKCWISVFGPPRQALLTDNGGEFSNEEIKTLGEHFNFNIQTTAAYSPYSNGICERNNAVITDIFTKMSLEYPDIDIDTVLAMTCMAKNNLYNNKGFSPAQVVFGSNFSLPNVLDDKLPALDEKTMGEHLARRIALIHSCRASYQNAESSDRIRRALRHNVRDGNETVAAGDTVFYYRESDKAWHGPGRIIGIDGQVFFIRHGGHVIKAHRTDILLEHGLTYSSQVQSEDTTSNPSLTRDPNRLSEFTSESLDDTLESGVTTAENTNSEKVSETVKCDPLETDSRTAEPQNTDSICSTDNSMLQDPPSNELETPESGSDTTLDSNVPAALCNTLLPKKIPKTKSVIMFKKTEEPDDGQSYIAKVISKAGKASGKHKNWLNLEYIAPDSVSGHREAVDCVNDLTDVYDITDNQEYESGFNSYSEDVDCFMMSVIRNEVFVAVADDVSQFKDAKLAEIRSWSDHGVFEVVPNDGQRVMSSRWVLSMKESTSGSFKPKARLVLKGFEETLQKIDKESPVINREIIKLFLSVITYYSWSPKSLDVKTAFLQGNTLDRPIYMRPPKEYGNQGHGKLWRILKPVYGLQDASRQWYWKVKQELERMGMKVCTFEPALFVWNKNGKIEGVICLHVDDFLFAGNSRFLETIIARICSVFEVGDIQETSLVFTGLKITTLDDQSLMLSQKGPNDALRSIPVPPGQRNGEPVDQSTVFALRSILGKLQWISSQTRPDISFGANSLATDIKNATLKRVFDVNKLVRKLQNTPNFGVRGPRIATPAFLVVYADASFQNLPDGGSQGGYVISVLDKDSQTANYVAWSSRRIRRIVRSTLAAEAISLHDGLDAAFLLREIFKFCTGITLQIIAFTDSKSLYEAIHSTKSVCEKRLRIEISAIQEMVRLKEVGEVIWIPTQEQLADALTKFSSNSCDMRSLINSGLSPHHPTLKDSLATETTHADPP